MVQPTLKVVSVQFTMAFWASCLTFKNTGESITVKPGLALTAESAQSVHTPCIGIAGRGSALINVHTSTSIKAKLISSLALAAMTPWQVHALGMSTTGARTICTLVYVVAVASISSVACSTLTFEGLSLLWDALGCGVTVMGPRVTRIHLVWTTWLHSYWADLVGNGISQDALLLHVHHEDSLHGDLQRLRGNTAVVPAVSKGDVLLQLERERLRAPFCRNNSELSHRGGGGNRRVILIDFFEWVHGHLCSRWDGWNVAIDDCIHGYVVLVIKAPAGLDD